MNTFQIYSYGCSHHSPYWYREVSRYLVGLIRPWTSGALAAGGRTDGEKWRRKRETADRPNDAADTLENVRFGSVFNLYNRLTITKKVKDDRR